MMAGYEWVILGDPIGKGRPRVGRCGTYTPRRTAMWEGLAAQLFAGSWRDRGARRAPLDEPLALELVAVFRRPKSMAGRKHTDGRLPHTKRPDFDNVAKIVGDALVKGGVVRDDSIIWRSTITKLYAARDEGPRVEVSLRTLEAAAQPEPGVLAPPRLQLVPPKEDSHGR